MVKNDYYEYVKTYRKRANSKEKERQELFALLNKRTRKAAMIIGPKYNLEKIYLFGSLNDINSFRLSSDIDLAVVNLKNSLYLELWGELEDILHHPFDLLQLEKASPSFKKNIKTEGVIIYDCQDYIP